MRRAERLFRLVGLLRSQQVSRAEDLADQLEMSVRTIYRDIAHLQSSGVPIDGEAGVGYILRPGFDLPPITLSPDQISALAIGLKFVIEAADPDLSQSAKEVRDKLSSVLPEAAGLALQAAPFFVARRDAPPPNFTPQIRHAIENRNVLSISYETPNAAPSKRTIEPLSLTVFTDGWMIGSWCRLRRDFRYFRLDRIAEISVTPEQFQNHPERNLTALRKARALETAAWENAPS
ncbi:MAG: helix-turn-helix transcriptional regulator [Halocynthiibacter sp.]